MNREALKLKIPDMRFNHIFSMSLQKEMKKQNKERVTTYILGKVIFKDIIIIPFLQNILWTSTLIILRDPLKNFFRNVRVLFFPSGRKSAL